MTDQIQSEGTDKAEQLEKIHEQAETISERAKTADERLNKFFASSEEPTAAPKAEEKPQEPIPSSEKTTTESKEEPEAKVEEPKAKETQELPENATERTKREFEKLKNRNVEMAEKLKTYEKQYGASVFDNPAPVVEKPVEAPVPQFDFSQPVQMVNPQQYVSPDGTVDIEGFNRAIALAEQRANAARAEALAAQERIQKFEESQAARELHMKHPELDPKQADKFDPEFFEMVRDRIVLTKMRGQTPDPIAIADTIRQRYTPAVNLNLDKVKDEAVTQYKEAQAKRNQGPIEQGKGSPREESATTLQSLRDRTRKGDPFALDQRMRSIGLLDKTS